MTAGGATFTNALEMGMGRIALETRAFQRILRLVLSETSNSSELPETRDLDEGELGVRVGRKLLRRRRLGRVAERYVAQ